MKTFRAFRVFRGPLLRELTAAWLCGALLLQSASAVAPDWWSVRNVLTPNTAADDYAVANIGQLKSMAKKAALAMNATLPGGAGTEIDTLIATWQAPPAPGVIRDDYAALTLTQLKSVARKFYNRLAAAGACPAGFYPWGQNENGPAPDDFAVANVGQLKHVFAMALPDSLLEGTQAALAALEAQVAGYQALLASEADMELLNARHQQILSLHASLTSGLNALAAAGVSAGDLAVMQAAATQAQEAAGTVPALPPALEQLLVSRQSSLTAMQWNYDSDGDETTYHISGWQGFYVLANRRGITHYLTAWDSIGETEPDLHDTVAWLQKHASPRNPTAFPPFDAVQKWEQQHSYDAPSFWPSVATGVDTAGWLRGGPVGSAFYADEHGNYTPPDTTPEDEETPEAQEVEVPQIGWEEVGLRMPAPDQICTRDVIVNYVVVRKTQPMEAPEGGSPEAPVSTVVGTAQLKLAAGGRESTATFTPAAEQENTGVSVRTVDGMQVLALEPPRQENKRVEVTLMPVEFITRQSKESETTVAVKGIGLTNQRPTVKLDSVSASSVSISNGTATVQIQGLVRDAIADNVPDGKGANIESVRILVNGEEQETATVNRQQDGAATAWRQFPCKGMIQPTSVSFAAQGVVTLRVETAPNAAGEIGYDEVQFRFDKQASGGTLVGGGTILYDLHLAGVPQPDSIDTLQAKTSAASSYTTLTETAAYTNVFASADGQFVVRLLSTPNLTNQVDEINCVVWDAASAYSASGSGGGSVSCVETGAATSTFQYTQAIQPIRTGVTYSHTLVEVINAEIPDAGGNHPFTWRMSGFGDAAQIKTKLGGATLDTHSYGGSLMPKGSEARHVIAYLVRDAEEENPPLKMLYYDETSQSVVAKTIGDPAELLKLKFVINQQETETIKLVQGQMEWRTPSGEPVEDLQKLPAQTLVDYINGDNDIEIDDDSAQVLRITAVNKDSPRVKVRSSEILTDFFELSKNDGSGSKQAKLKEIAPGIFESEQEIIVYESSPGIQTLSESQWQALKEKGYLAVHNLSAEALQIINDTGLDDLAEEAKQDHHIFNQWDGKNVNPRYKKFWSEVFDPGTFDVHDFTVEVAQKRHARFSRGCTDAWKSFIDSVTDAQGKILPHLTKEYVRGETVEMAIDLAEHYNVPLEKVRRYPPKAAGLVKPAFGSKLDDLIKLDSTHNPIRWGDPTDHRSLRWKKYTSKAVSRFGKGFVRSMPFLGYAMTAWTVVAFASNASAAVASELNISPEAAQLLLEGKVSARLQLWQPNSPVQTAQLVSGGSVHIGMTHFYAHMQFSDLYDTWYATRVEEGEVVGIETTARTGVVNLRVRVGQEERLHPNVNGVRSGIPEEGKPAPSGW